MRRTGISTVIFFILVGTSIPAFAADQGGRVLKPSTCCNGEYLDGIWAYIDPTNLTPPSGCVLFSTLVNEGSIKDQLETGVTKCSTGSGIDGTCGTNGAITRFYETEIGGNYLCYTEGTQSLNTRISYSVRVEQVSGGVYAAYIDGAPYGNISGMNANYTNAIAWGEQTPGSSCSQWSGDGYISNVDYYNRASGFHGVYSNFTAYTSSSSCWTVGGYASQAFEVYHYR